MLPKVLKPSLPKKPKLLRSNPLRLSLIRTGNDPYNVPDDEDILNGYRPHRLKLRRIDDDTELSPYVKFRLFLARQMALAKYKEVHG